MKQTIILALFLCATSLLPHVTSAQVTPDDPANFITTWNTENPGTSASNQITIPGAGGGYNYEIYWENTASSTIYGTTSLITTSSYTLTFPEPGIYEVQLSGAFPRIYFNNTGDKDKILQVNQWGNIAWSSMQWAFWGASNLRVPATDAPDLSGVTTMQSMFQGASSFNDPIEHWDVSNVLIMEGLFYGATSFNQALNNWNVSSVVDFLYTFGNATSFNQPLDNWMLSSTADIRAMFSRAASFNQSLNDWDVSGSTSFFRTFLGATSFNQPLDQWDTSKVTDMEEMFYQASSFNQDISMWNTASVTKMIRLFREASSFNQDISNWDTGSVQFMNDMFRGATSFNQSLNEWNLSSVTSFYRMFSGATSFNQPLDQWDTSSVTGATNVFNDAINFNQDLSTWNITSVNNMGGIFQNSSLSTENLDTTLSSWATQASTSNITNIPFHLGLKTYSTTGAQALNTLQDLGWTITEQYQATYSGGEHTTLIGTGTQAPLNSGATTTPVEIIPDNRCSFIEWSDGNTDNPRSDTVTDNLTVSAVVNCSSPSGTSARTQAARTSDPARAADITDRFLTDDTTNTPSPYTPPETLEESLEEVNRLPDTIDRIKASNPTPETVRTLISLLLELVQALTLLLMEGGGEVTS